METKDDLFQGTFKDDNGSIILEMARQQLQTQLAFAQALDAKIGSMFAAGSALVGLLAAVFALQKSQTLGEPERALLVVALVAFAIVFLGSFLAVWVKTWEAGPEIETAFKDGQELSKDQFIGRQISSYMDEYERNSGKKTFKAWALRVSQLAVTAEVGCLAAAAWMVVF